MRGFTLLEIMVAVGIVGLLMTTLFAAYSGTLEVAATVQDRTRTAEVARLVIGQIDRDLSCFFPPAASEQNATENPVFQGGAAAIDTAESGDMLLLEFPTTSTLEFSTAFPVHTVSRVQYVLRPDDSDRHEDRYTLVRKQLRFPDVNSKWEEVELADLLREAAVSFVDRQNMELGVWDSNAADEEARYPELVRISLTFDGEDSTTRQYSHLVRLGGVVQ